jgi:hypothetical protein
VGAALEDDDDEVEEGWANASDDFPPPLESASSFSFKQKKASGDPKKD